MFTNCCMLGSPSLWVDGGSVAMIVAWALFSGWRDSKKTDTALILHVSTRTFEAVRSHSLSRQHGLDSQLHVVMRL